MDERFVEALIHKRAPLVARWRGYSGYIILGRRLRPFSFWHQELLDAVGSPFLRVWDKQPTSLQLIKSLYLAVTFCQVEPFDVPKSGRLQTLLRKWAVFRFYMLPGLGRPGTRLLRLLREAAKFRAYMADYCSVSIPFPKRGSTRIQSPVSAYQLELYRSFHPDVTERKAWALSPGEVSWANVSAQEAGGKEISIMTRERQEAREIAMRGGRKPKGNGSHV